MREINRRSSAVIFTRGVNRRRITETTQIFGERFGGDRLRLESADAQQRVEIELRIPADQRFRERRWLDKKEPVIVRRGQRFIDVVVYIVRRDDIKHGKLGDARCMIERQTV